MDDSVWLYNVPEFYDAIQWSEDNLIAVAAGHTVVVLSPAELQGPRSHLSMPAPETEPLQAGCKPSNYDSSLHLALALYGEMHAQESSTKSTVRAVAWSPAGCTPQGGCLLTCITSDHKVPAGLRQLPPAASPALNPAACSSPCRPASPGQAARAPPPPPRTPRRRSPPAPPTCPAPTPTPVQVRIFSASPSAACITWTQVTDLSAQLKAHLEDEGWQVGGWGWVGGGEQGVPGSLALPAQLHAGQPHDSSWTAAGRHAARLPAAAQSPQPAACPLNPSPPPALAPPLARRRFRRC
jgi:hypothetical protein